MLYLLAAIVVISLYAAIAYYQGRQMDKEYRRLLNEDKAKAEAALQAYLNAIRYII